MLSQSHTSQAWDLSQHFLIAGLLHGFINGGAPNENDFSPSSVSKPQMAPPLFAFWIRHYVKNHSYIIIFLVAFASLGAAIHSAAYQFGTARDKWQRADVLRNCFPFLLT